jgi:hypothetical protein
VLLQKLLRARHENTQRHDPLNSNAECLGLASLSANQAKEGAGGHIRNAIAQIYRFALSLRTAAARDVNGVAWKHNAWKRA